MTRTLSEAVLSDKLHKLLEPTFPGMQVEVQQDPRYKKRVIAFRWRGFDGLLAEERFHRLLRAIPEDFHGTHLRNCIWFELGERETREDYLKLPRSDDVRASAPRILERLGAAGFSERLAAELGSSPAQSCDGDFSHARGVLSTLGWKLPATHEALLAILGAGACCDCQALKILETKPAKTKKS